MSQGAPPTPPPPHAPGPGGPPAGMRPHRGVMILIFGILSFVCCFIFGIVAFIMGGNDLKAMDAGQMDPEGRGLTNAGRIVGLIGAILAGLWMVLYAILMITGALSGGFNP